MWFGGVIFQAWQLENRPIRPSTEYEGLSIPMEMWSNWLGNKLSEFRLFTVFSRDLRHRFVMLCAQQGNKWRYEHALRESLRFIMIDPSDPPSSPLFSNVEACGFYSLAETSFIPFGCVGRTDGCTTEVLAAGIMCCSGPIGRRNVHDHHAAHQAALHHYIHAWRSLM